MMKVRVGYNQFEEELTIMERAADGAFERVRQVLDPQSFARQKERLKAIHLDEEIKRYILSIVTATRDPEACGLEELRAFIDFGASPRGSIDLYKAARAHAWLQERDFVTPADVAAMAYPVLRHRIVLNYHAVTADLDTDRVIRKILETIPAP